LICPNTDTDHSDQSVPVLFALLFLEGRDAARQLADLLTKQGRRDEAERLRRFGLNPDGSIARA
jgi:hypothetical protein